MTRRWITITICSLAFVVGCVLRLWPVWAGEATSLVFFAAIMATFFWIFVKTRFSTANYTTTVWRVQLIAIWSLIGFNLALFAEDFA